MGNITSNNNSNKNAFLFNKAKTTSHLTPTKVLFDIQDVQSTASSGSSTSRTPTGVCINDTIPFKNGSYTGSVLLLGDGTRVPHGIGTITYPETHRFSSITANFHIGIAIGEATLQFSKMKYVGPVDSDNEPHGRGKYEYEDSETYKRLHASFDHGHLLTQVVTIEYRRGDVYCGSIMARGMPNGRGIAFYAQTGNRYEGEFQRGIRTNGKVIDPKGKVIQTIKPQQSTLEGNTHA